VTWRCEIEAVELQLIGEVRSCIISGEAEEGGMWWRYPNKKR
jgi:hypothetical protein